MRILLVEDDPMVGKAIRAGLSEAGFAVDWLRDGSSALTALQQRLHDAVVLDLGLPGMDGRALLDALRREQNAVPVLIVSARDTVAERVASLESGADDYLLKPFDFDELLARLRALLRRHAGSASPLLAAGPVLLDPLRRTVTFHGQSVELSAREFAVLEALMRRPGAVLSRDKLETSVYGWGAEVGSNAIEVHLHNLRRKLGADTIVNVRGVGYRMATGSAEP